MRAYCSSSARPREIYNHPVNDWVAGFVGEPPMNFLDCVLEERTAACTSSGGGRGGEGGGGEGGGDEGREGGRRDQMRTIRDFEERVHEEFSAGNIPGFVHLYAGEEASGVGVCMHLTD